MKLSRRQSLHLATGGASRRDFLRYAGTATALSALLGSDVKPIPARAQSAAGPADAIFRGGPILTMNDAVPRAVAVAVKDGKIIAIGTRTDVDDKLTGLQTRTVDLQGRTLIPGFVDSHSHVSGTGMVALMANLLPPPDGEANDIASLQQLLRAWDGGLSPLKRYGWIIGFGYDDSQLKERRHPNRDDLDKVSNDRPILVTHQSGHLGAINSKALELLGVTAATADPNGGVYRRRPGSREPDGVLEEAANSAAYGKLIGQFDSDTNQALIRRGAERMASYGYTTAQDGALRQKGVLDLMNPLIFK
jgi:predicted amidohydrolase YtcJ